MKKILLFCCAGMSSSVLAQKMRDAAKEKNIDVEIEAYHTDIVEKKLDEVDVVLLGPQIRYDFKRHKKVCDKKNIPIEVIPVTDYGLMRGDKVLDLALELIEYNELTSK